ncbi:hypothetical protein EIN_306710 [Entamoeba invadens IP1]|uniref:Signal recognition particle receptor subunit beta n=1 Tax=Entamoeba invadens IP1 TaxID=370355 RepID=A0A0A1TYX2_ENTIV|nr:hypothetical protein EIN_306710 [Entamoeba invadens IP1]ELP86725.1 hypothetical protein EIN_306710 [Entamoeba invadens IP1]|eukprot:XP_004186071.1 hypothetical protein EIN_306710 [Entamoeba invadens IP1]
MLRSSLSNASARLGSRSGSITIGSGLYQQKERYQYTLMSTSSYLKKLNPPNSSPLRSSAASPNLPDSSPLSPVTSPDVRSRSSSSAALEQNTFVPLETYTKEQVLLRTKSHTEKTESNYPTFQLDKMSPKSTPRDENEKVEQTLLLKELQALTALPTATRTTATNIYLASYSDALTSHLNLFLTDFKACFKHSMPHISTHHSERTRYFGVETAIGFGDLNDVIFLSDSVDIYVIIADSSDLSFLYLTAFVQKLAKAFGSQAIKKVVVYTTSPNTSVNTYCQVNDIPEVTDRDVLKAEITRHNEEFQKNEQTKSKEPSKRVILLGDYFVGKTTLFHHLTNSKYNGYEASFETFTKKESRNEFDVIDTPGNFRFQVRLNKEQLDTTMEGKNEDERAVELTMNYLHEKQIGGELIVVLYDVTRKETKRYAELLTESLQRVFPFSSVVVIGNKLDIADELKMEVEECAMEGVSDILMMTLSDGRVGGVIDKLRERLTFLMQPKRLDLVCFKKSFGVEETYKVCEDFCIESGKSAKSEKRLVRVERGHLIVLNSKGKASGKSRNYNLDENSAIVETQRKKMNCVVIKTRNGNIGVCFKDEKKEKEFKENIIEAQVVNKIGKGVLKVICKQFLREALNELVDEDIETFTKQVENYIGKTDYVFPDHLKTEVDMVVHAPDRNTKRFSRLSLSSK